MNKKSLIWIFVLVLLVGNVWGEVSYEFDYKWELDYPTLSHVGTASPQNLTESGGEYNQGDNNNNRITTNQDGGYTLPTS